MTKVESYHAEALKLLSKSKLNEFAKNFVRSIRNYEKKDLKQLTSNQYNYLRQISEGKHNK